VEETRAKAAGLLAAVSAPVASAGRAVAAKPAWLPTHPEVREALKARNAFLSRFWLQPPGQRAAAVPALVGRRVLVIDAEDTFTAMLGHQLRSLGPMVTVTRFDEDFDLHGYDLIVVGPGPGDPRIANDPKIAKLRSMVWQLLADRTAFLAVCLGHQVLASLLGFALVRKAVPNQGLQREINFFGRSIRVGCYNTFYARCDADEVVCAGVPGTVEVCRDPATGEVHGLRAGSFRSVQFHLESVLTEDGPSVLADMITSLLPVGTSTW
jgi:phenazine biosynthesis protein phzE